MRAALAKSFGEPEEVLSVVSDHPKPKVVKGKVLVHVKACSLSPGDWRMLLGHAPIVKKPPEFPYIPGGDVCGVIAEVSEDEKRFKVGDEVIGTWEGFGIGGLAEYTLVDTQYCEPKPPNISFVEGAAIADSPVNAMLACEDGKVAAGDRLLVIGGSGAVGGSVIQLAKQRGVSFIAATSTNADLVKSLGADVVLNYNETNWWEVPEFKEQPFDVIIDCAEGRVAWECARKHKVLKSGKQHGRFVAVVPQEWIIEIHSSFQMMKWFLPVMRRQMASRMFGSLPRYTMLFPAPRGDSSARWLKLFQESNFRIVLDEGSPWPLTTEGVKGAFQRSFSRRATGKIVISIE